MRGFWVVVLASLVIGLMPVSAQTVFTQGVYQFESVVASMTYSGTWTTTAPAGGGIGFRSATVNASSVQFEVIGETLVVWRWVTFNGTGTMNLCIEASCIVVSNGSTVDSGWIPYNVTLPTGQQTVTLTRIGGATQFDYFMVLDPAGGAAFPTAVPTATILPSSTPASTTTPQPTPTPQPTATPYTMPGAIWAIDPARSYSSIDGQITSVEYSATAADIHTANLLKMLLFSIWGMFIFVVFVLVRFKR